MSENTEVRLPADERDLRSWRRPASVGAVITGRAGGASRGAYGDVRGGPGLNLGARCGDEPDAVAANRRWIADALGVVPVWMQQVHGTQVVRLDEYARGHRHPGSSGFEGVEEPTADAATCRQPGIACAVLVADCMPVLLCDVDGTVVGAAHAGWRGMAAGVIERTVAAMGVAPGRILAYLGPSIGPGAFQVGSDVRNAFVDVDPATASAFVDEKPGKWLANLPWLARRRLERLGVPGNQVSGGTECTVRDPTRFYSFRRDRVTGRMAGLVWLRDPR